MSKGFTIIELLVSMSIIFLLVGFTFAGYARFNARQQLNSAGQSLKNTLRDIQSRAYNGEMDCTVCDCSVSGDSAFKGWYVDFTAQKIYGECIAPDATQPTYAPKTLGLGAQVTVFPSPVSKIMFRYSPPGVDLSTNVCLSLSNLADTYYLIKINQSGDITDDGGLTSSCTP